MSSIPNSKFEQEMYETRLLMVYDLITETMEEEMASYYSRYADMPWEDFDTGVGFILKNYKTGLLNYYHGSYELTKK